MMKATILIPAYQPNVHMLSLVRLLSGLGAEHILIVDDGSRKVRCHRDPS